MSTSWTVTLLDAATHEFDELHPEARASFLYVAELLETRGPTKVGMPHSRPLRDKVWEMRLRSQNGIARALYQLRPGRVILVARIFVKKTQTTPPREIDLALRRLKEES